jgi:hypothetical protein
MTIELVNFVISESLLEKIKFEAKENKDYNKDVESLKSLRIKFGEDENDFDSDQFIYTKNKEIIERVYSHHLFLFGKQEKVEGIKKPVEEDEISLLNLCEFFLARENYKVNTSLWKRYIPASDRVVYSLSGDTVKRVLGQVMISPEFCDSLDLFPHEKKELMDILNFLSKNPH